MVPDSGIKPLCILLVTQVPPQSANRALCLELGMRIELIYAGLQAAIRPSDSPSVFGAGEGLRSLCLLLGKQTLYQLSYTRVIWSRKKDSHPHPRASLPVLLIS